MPTSRFKWKTTRSARNLNSRKRNCSSPHPSWLDSVCPTSCGVSTWGCIVILNHVLTFIAVEFNVENILPIEWNEEAFADLVLPSDRKMLLQSLVESHNAELNRFDDFIKGKGRGLVVNLFGPPGVGKTLSAEATSEREDRMDLKT
jgi:hypothetical protein